MSQPYNWDVDDVFGDTLGQSHQSFNFDQSDDEPESKKRKLQADRTRSRSKRSRSPTPHPQYQSSRREKPRESRETSRRESRDSNVRDDRSPKDRRRKDRERRDVSTSRESRVKSYNDAWRAPTHEPRDSESRSRAGSKSNLHHTPRRSDKGPMTPDHVVADRLMEVIKPFVQNANKEMVADINASVKSMVHTELLQFGKDLLGNVRKIVTDTQPKLAITHMKTPTADAKPPSRSHSPERANVPLLQVHKLSEQKFDPFCINPSFKIDNMFSPWSLRSICEMLTQAGICYPIVSSLGRVFEGQLSQYKFAAQDVLAHIGIMPRHHEWLHMPYADLHRHVDYALATSRQLLEDTNICKELALRIADDTSPRKKLRPVKQKKPEKKPVLKQLPPVPKFFPKIKVQKRKGGKTSKRFAPQLGSSTGASGSNEPRNLAQTLHDKKVRAHADLLMEVARDLGESSSLYENWCTGKQVTPDLLERFYRGMHEELCCHSVSMLGQSRSCWRRWKQYANAYGLDAYRPHGNDIYQYLEYSLTRGNSVAMSELERMVFLKKHTGFRLPSDIPYLNKLRYEGNKRNEKTALAPVEIEHLEILAATSPDYGTRCMAGAILLGVWSSSRACHLQRSHLEFVNLIEGYAGFSCFQAKRSGKHEFKYFVSLIGVTQHKWWETILEHLQKRDHDYIFESDMSFTSEHPTPMSVELLSSLVRDVLKSIFGETPAVMSRTGHSMRRALVNIAYFCGMSNQDCRLLGLWADPDSKVSESMPHKYSDDRLTRAHIIRCGICHDLQRYSSEVGPLKSFTCMRFCRMLGHKMPKRPDCDYYESDEPFDEDVVDSVPVTFAPRLDVDLNKALVPVGAGEKDGAQEIASGRNYIDKNECSLKFQGTECAWYRYRLTLNTVDPPEKISLFERVSDSTRAGNKRMIIYQMTRDVPDPNGGAAVTEYAYFREKNNVCGWLHSVRDIQAMGFVGA